MENQEEINLKSFFYKLSSVNVGFNVYKSNNPHRICIEHLICSNCKSFWETGNKECYFCGTPNYHLFTCLECHKQSSITSSGKKCPYCGANGTLRQLCLNKNCPTNNENNEYLYNKVRNKSKSKSGAIFQGDGGFYIRQNSCKKCGSRFNEYSFAEINVVLNKNEATENYNNVFNVYIEREDSECPAKFYYTDNKQFDSIQNLLKYILD
ncbi:hypothetical protein DY120_00755 [Apilactobacillus micheneri]|uniref:SH2 domain-containing protein n=1 Tax=Apilactobacillus micheneri TaxID=1899430 RepID=A0ABY2YZ88_9LACO|nr:hypothetical protein [Apilactobacillus micheneri]TPR26260.1 hypothetical protein DY114_00755 [Apilactobacillus micheneri]TPR27014.1 hypothetical protein DY111_00755 [Apilactobacillus micheneri]TPR27872.1 hypothetical protein DY113_04530 [Apilactobacillus micheneri]TPR31777.1 hypothetical protein DY117_00755 [Apilactobacillus micheneri]TPR32181.1 hypothetical protein DY120_00755 [Apilactobacillus micheneri]